MDLLVDSLTFRMQKVVIFENHIRKRWKDFLAWKIKEKCFKYMWFDMSQPDDDVKVEDSNSVDKPEVGKIEN